MRQRRVAMLASKFRPSATNSTEARASAIASEIRELSPTHTAEKSKRALLQLCETARQYVAQREFGNARRVIADATAVLNEVQDEATVALASVHLGEALLAVDLPHYARVHLARAAATYQAQGDARWTARARVGLGRALMALDEPLGREMLEEMRAFCTQLGDHRLLAIVQATLGTPENPLAAGFARPITIPPPSEE